MLHSTSMRDILTSDYLAGHIVHETISKIYHNNIVGPGIQGKNLKTSSKT